MPRTDMKKCVNMLPAGQRQRYCRGPHHPQQQQQLGSSAGLPHPGPHKGPTTYLWGPVMFRRWGPSSVTVLKCQSRMLVHFVAQICLNCYGIGDKSKSFQKLLSRLRLLLLLLLLLQLGPGKSRDSQQQQQTWHANNMLP